MKHIIIMMLLLIVSALGIGPYAQEGKTAAKQTSGNTVSPAIVIVDDYSGVSLVNRNWYYTTIGTDRGEMGDGVYTVNIGGGNASVTVNSGWGGVWTALIHNISANHFLNPTQLLGPYIKSQYQPYITGVEIDITNGSGKFKIELKDEKDNLLWQNTRWLSGGSQTLQYSITPTGKIAKLNWLVDGKGYVTVDEVRFVIKSPNYKVLEAVFLFTYGHLCQCYDADSGLVRDRANWPVQDYAAVQTIGTFALASAVAWDLGYITESNARAIIRKTKNTLLNLPRHPKGLLPHFLKNGNIVKNTEWSSVDTTITLISQILACQAIDEDTAPLEAMLQTIDWNDLTSNGAHSIGMGYDYNGQKLPNYWDTFGAEALLAAIAYSAATGDNNVKLERFSQSPTWDGSGFNDELAALFFPIVGNDRWGNNWTHYREEAFQEQIDYFSNHRYASFGFFGLSACEVPEPWTVEEDDVYQAWGVGGHNNHANDGSSAVGYPIIAPHYAAMIAAEHPGYAEPFFRYLLETQSVFTPLNNVESFGIDNNNNLRWNSLKGAWNLSLQVLGAGRALSGDNYLPYRVLTANSFLEQGFNGIMPPSVTVTSPNGSEDWQIGTSHPITWTSNGLSGNVTIDLYKGGNLLSNIGTAAVEAGTFAWNILPGLTTGNDFKVRISQNSIEDYSDSNFSITSGTPPEILLGRNVLNFGTLPSLPTSSQDILIKNNGGGTLVWSASSDQSWLQVSPAGGSGSGIVTVSVDASGLNTGSYSGTISIEDPHATNSPQRVTVGLQIYSNGASQPPFGSFDTPGDGSTVCSSIPVTGWVLDDIGVCSVKIYLAQENNLVYIGDALLVEGARPDIEQTYPGYPFNYKAGWGYMMLTNFLPDGGNGTFTLKTKAVDEEGNEVTLGSKTIICDNANAVNPFGAIDTPAPGGSAAGNNFLNAGWVLTPQPNIIPTTGLSVSVYVDGVYLGHPTYNIYREDIAGLFPAYANSNGAGGQYRFDTTTYENGVHTILWTATDNAGNSDGIGSRYFTVQNSSSGRTHVTGINGHEEPDISNIPAKYSDSILFRKGYNENSKQQSLFPGKDGIIDIEIKELERVEIALSNNLTWQGYLVIGGDFRPLPIGATFDSEKCHFYWQPGAGFIGEYRLVFVGKGLEIKTPVQKREVIIKILPKY